MHFQNVSMVQIRTAVEPDSIETVAETFLEKSSIDN